MSEYKPGQILQGYCTKYALTAGIIGTSAEVAITDTRYAVSTGSNLSGCFMRIGKNFFVDKSMAEAAAKHMARNKRRSLEMQLSKITKLCVVPKYAKEK